MLLHRSEGRVRRASAALAWLRALAARPPRRPRNRALERLSAADRLIWSGRTGSYSFERADMRGERLSGKDLQSATFFGAVLTGVDAAGAGLDRAILVAVDARGACFHTARLDSAILIGADFSDADLTAANLTGADLARAILRGADLRGAMLTGASLAGAVYDDRTRWPAGLEPAARGAKLWVPGEVVPAASPGGRGDEPAAG